MRKTQTSGLDIKVYFVFVYLHQAGTRKQISLFFVFEIPHEDSYFSVFYPSQMKAY